MAEASTSASPAAQSAPPATTPATPVAATTGAKELVGQSKPQEQAAKVEPAVDADVERRAAILAAGKRQEAKLRADRQKFEQERLTRADDLKLAAEMRRLDALKKSDPAKFLEEIGLDLGAANQAYLRKATGAGQTPVEIAKAEAERVYADKEKARADAAEKADAERQAKAQAQTLEGAKRQLLDMAKAAPEKYELTLEAGPSAIADAWKLIEDFHAETFNKATGVGQVLDFSKALDAIEAREEKSLEKRLSGSKGKAAQERLTAAAEAAAKEKKPAATLSSTKLRSAVEPRSVETESRSPTPTPQRKRQLLPTDQKRIAEELWQQHAAKQDN